jgi:hypothetical protein
MVLTETKHNRPFLFVHGVKRLENHVADYQDACKREDGPEAAGTSAAAATASAGLATLAAQHFVELVETFFQRLIEVWRPLIIAASTTTGTPGVIVVTVSTRFVPGHSALRY